MPLRFSKQPLRLLDAIYGFIGGQTGPKEFAIESAIQPVHDLSRSAELAGFGTREGYWVCEADQVHVAAGSITDAIDVYNPAVSSHNARNGWIDGMPPDLRVWILDCWGVLAGTDTLFNHAEIEVGTPADIVGISTGAAAGFDRLLWTGDTGTLGGNIFLAGAPSKIAEMPVRLEPGELMTMISEQAGAGTVTVRLSAMMWVGVQGAAPPGLS